MVRRRHFLVTVLTFVTGCADATGFLTLGGAFSSVMTGNMVLLGLSTGRMDLALAITAGSAIGSYILGVLVGARIAGIAALDDPVWPRQVSRALTVEVVVLVGFLVVWEVTLQDRSGAAELWLLALAAAALGIQSSAVQRFGVAGLSSTYLTGTLTSLIGAVATGRPLKTVLPSAQALSALIGGAAVGTVTVLHIPIVAPLLLIVPLVGVVVAGSHGNGADDPPPSHS